MVSSSNPCETSPAGMTVMRIIEVPPPEVDRQRADLRPLAALRGVVQRRPQLDAQARVDGVQQVAAGLAAAVLQEASGARRQVQDVVFGVEQQRRRRDGLEQLEVQLGPDTGRPFELIGERDAAASTENTESTTTAEGRSASWASSARAMALWPTGTGRLARGTGRGA